MTVQGGPLEAGQSIDVPESASLCLANDLTSDGTITMEAAGPAPSYLDLDGHTLTNAGTFNVDRGHRVRRPDSSGTFDNTGTMQIAGTFYSSRASFTNSTGGLHRR